MILDAVRASGGRAVATNKHKLVEWARMVGQTKASRCAQVGACFDVLARGIAEGFIAPTDRVVVFNTGAAQKYVEALQAPLARLRRDAIDWQAIAG